MPDDGWSVPWPRRDDDDLGAWEQFVSHVSHVDPEQLRHELYGTGGGRLEAERPGFSAPDVPRRTPPGPQTDPLVALLMEANGVTLEQAVQQVVAARRENRNHHTRGTAA